MSLEAWIAIAAAAAVLLTVAGGLWSAGKDQGEIKSDVKALLSRDERTAHRVDTIELRLNDHTERLARLEGPQERQVRL